MTAPVKNRSNHTLGWGRNVESGGIHKTFIKSVPKKIGHILKCAFIKKSTNFCPIFMKLGQNDHLVRSVF